MGLTLAAAFLVAVRLLLPGQESVAFLLCASVLGSTISLIRIMELLTICRTQGSAIPVASLGFLWIFKLVCLGIFVITLKSNPQTHAAIVIGSICFIFVPVVVGVLNARK